MSHTPAPLFVRISKSRIDLIETVDSAGDVVFERNFPCKSSKDKTTEDVIECRHFKHDVREECIQMNKRALADEILRAAAPDLLEALKLYQEAAAIKIPHYIEQKDAQDIKHEWLGHHNVCSKYGTFYGGTCLCCKADYERELEQAQIKARRKKDDMLMKAGEKARAAIQKAEGV